MTAWARGRRQALIGLVILVHALAAKIPAWPAEKAPRSPQLASWPQFRAGASRTGHNDNEIYLKPTNVPGLSIKWEYATGGALSNTSAIVAKTVLYAIGGDKNLHAMVADTGTDRWVYSSGTSTFSGSPAVGTGGLVIGIDDEVANSRLVSLDTRTGAVHWDVDLATGSVPTAPLVSAGKVFIGVGTDLVALNETTGSELWRLPYSVDLTNPGSIGTALYFPIATDMKAFDPLTGQELWTAPEPNGSTFTTPAFKSGAIYVSSSGTVDSVHAIDAATGAIRWSTPLEGSFLQSSVAVANGRVYVFDQAKLYVISITSGAILWTETIAEGTASSPAVANGVVYAGGSNGHLYAFRADKQMSLLDLDSGTLSLGTPSVANGRVYAIADDGGIYSFGL